MPRPRGGEWLADETSALRSEGVDVLVSLMSNGECEELQLLEEGAHCDACGVEFLSHPVTDRGLPADTAKFEGVVDAVAERIKQGKGVAIHCRLGIGRSSLLAAAVLVSLGARTEEAFEKISHARGLPVPDTEEQRQWVEKYEQRLRS